jgi:DNA-binding SARP family transcriptional activator
VLSVLGEPGITVGKDRHSFSGELVCRLAMALCAAYPEALTQDELGDVLWEHEPPPTWRSALRVHISRLRALLGTDPTGPQLRSTSAGYALAGEEGQLDFILFRDLVARSTVAPTVTDRLELLTAALSLWNGSSLLVTDHPVLRSFLDRLEGSRRAAERDRYRALIELSRHEEVVAELLGAKAEDRINEGCVEPLVAALILSDRRKEAQEILNEARDLLGASGLETGVGLQSLQRQLFAKEFEVLSVLRSENFAAMAERGQDTFVGRDVVLEELLVLVSEGTQWCLIEGDGGIGKSRVVDEVCRSMAADGASVLYASCIEYSPPGQLFKDLIASAAPGMSFTDLDPVESLGLCTESLGGRPLLLVVEDLHNVDLLSSKQLRRFLFQRRRDSLSVVISTRPGPWPPFIRELIIDFLVDSRTKHFVLEGFSREIVDEWLAVKFAGRRSRRWEIAGNIQRLSGGLPLLIELFLRKGNFDHLELNQDSLDHRVVPLVANLERSMTEQQSEIIAIGALCGLEFVVAVVAEVAGCSAAQLFDAADAAHRLGVTRKRNGQVVSFRHDLIREAIIWERSEVWRSRTHRRIAEVMTKRDLDEGSICLHLSSALTDAQDVAEVDEVLRRVERLQAASRWDTSTIALESCEKNVSTQPWLFTERSHFALLRLLGRSYEGSHDTAKARACFRRAVQVAGANIELISIISIDSAGGSLPYDGDAERLAWLRLSLGSSSLSQRQRLTVLAECVKLQAMVGVTADVMLACDEMLVLGAQFDDNEAIATVAYGQSVIQLLSPETNERLVTIRGVERTDPSLRSEVALTTLLVELVSVLELGQLSKAWVLHHELEAMTEQSQRPGEQWLARVVKSVLLDWEGREGEATVEANGARLLAERHEVRNGIEVWTVFALSRALRDDRWLELPVPGDQGAPSPTASGFGAAIALVMRSRLRVFDGFAADIQALVTRLAEEPKYLGWLGVVALTADANCYGPGDSAEELIALLLPYSGKMIVNGVAPAAVFGPVDFYLALLERQCNNRAAAREYSLRALSFAQSSSLMSWLDRLTQMVQQFEDDTSD